MSLKDLDPNQMIITFASVRLQGFADGSFITFEPDGPAYVSKTGADGEKTRVKQNFRGCKFKVKLMQSSDSNDVLAAIAKLDANVPNGAGVAPFIAKDLSGRTVFIAPETWIEMLPSSEWAREPTEREWSFECAECEAFIGGN